MSQDNPDYKSGKGNGGDDEDFEMGSFVAYCVPPGSYEAEFFKVKKIQTMHGEKIKWIFKLLKKKHNGNLVDGLGPLEAGERNNSGRILQGLTNEPLDPKQKVKLSDFYGTRGKVTIAKGTTEGTCNVVDFHQEEPEDDEDE
jgi:hypothetical protein